jgi:hypothetical protein
MPRRPSSSRATLKRWTLVKLPLSLLAGAVVTWGVAWGCVLWAPLSESSYDHTSKLPPPSWPALLSHEWLVQLPPLTQRAPLPSEPASPWYDFGTLGPPSLEKYQTFTCTAHTGFGVRVRDCRVDEVDPRAHINRMFFPRAAEYSAGWPLFAMTGWSEPELFNATPARQGDAIVIPQRVFNRVVVPRTSASWRWQRFPTRILPLGFTLNALLAAGMLLGLVEGLAFARRRVRRAKKGGCLSCGYDRGGLAKDAACPECGAKV